jgi:peptidoglycan/xylan/chitin deacetylase (PgdA/CDA1 family)
VRAVRAQRRFAAPFAAAIPIALVALASAPLAAAASGVMTHGPRSKPQVALTFDDGWSAGRCTSIVRTLRAKGATATFFINGTYLRNAPSRWRTILRGFPIANHTLSHANLATLSAGGVRAQIVLNERILERALGRQMLRVLRPPYGAYDADVIRVADSLGYRTLLWDVDSGDTHGSATTSSVIRNAVRGGRGAIVLLHCGPSVTPAAVGPIIDSYRRRGYDLVGLDEMLFGRSVDPRACHIRNRESDRVSGSLAAAVKAARKGHHLTVRGTCVGSTAIGKDLTLRGVSTKDSGPPTLDGRRRGTVLTVRRGATVTLRELGIIRGKARSGGGVVNLGSLTLLATDVSRNRARTFGGGILNRGGLVIGGDSTVRGNRAKDGAGLTNRGTASLRGGSSITRNDASGYGGGVYNKGHLAMSAGSVVARNEAGTAGGGLLDASTIEGVVCAPELEPNVRNNAPDDCAVPAPVS